MARGIMLFRPLILRRQLAQGHEFQCKCYHSQPPPKSLMPGRKTKYQILVAGRTEHRESWSSAKIIGNSLPQKSLATPPFQKLVESFKSTGQTCTIIESSCGGLIFSSLMSVSGSSRFDPLFTVIKITIPNLSNTCHPLAHCPNPVRDEPTILWPHLCKPPRSLDLAPPKKPALRRATTAPQSKEKDEQRL